jgi:hypothetical protein
LVTGERPIRNEMCATDVYCAATVNTTETTSPNTSPAASTAAQRLASSRGGLVRHAGASAKRKIGSAHAARATVIVTPSNTPGSAA